jgi:hypothetical protein
MREKFGIRRVMKKGGAAAIRVFLLWVWIGVCPRGLTQDVSKSHFQPKGMENKQAVSVPTAAESDLIEGYDALHYRLELEFPLPSNRFSGVMTLTAKSLREGLTKLVLHDRLLSVLSVRVNGEPAAVDASGGLLTVPLTGILSNLT